MIENAMDECRGCQARDKTIALLEQHVTWLQGRLEKAQAAPQTPAPPLPLPAPPEQRVGEALEVRDAQGRRYRVTADGLVISEGEYQDAMRMLNDQVNGRPPYPVEGSEGPGTGGIV